MFISRIKELRIQRKITQMKLSKLAKLSQMEISYLERGKKNPSLDTLCKISKAFDFDELEEDLCIYELFKYKCPKYNSCTRSSKSHLECYIDIEFEKDSDNYQI